MKSVIGAAIVAALFVSVPLTARPSPAPFSFAANARKHGVHQTKSGLQYRVIKPGNGPSPRGEEAALVVYAGRFPDGRTFDASKAPVALPLNKVIKGFAEGLALMRKGATYRFWIPPELGYGTREMRDDDGTVAIPANSILMFDVTLVDVLPPQSEEVLVPVPQ
jgi:FKBP-type peptidyl-prolyl cis-trans isomerase FkpA